MLVCKVNLWLHRLTLMYFFFLYDLQQCTLTYGCINSMLRNIQKIEIDDAWNGGGKADVVRRIEIKSSDCKPVAIQIEDM